MRRTIGILRESVSRFERRAPLTPRHVQRLTDELNVEVLVQSSAQRVFADCEFAGKAGAINTLRGLGLHLAALGHDTPLLALRGANEYATYAQACKALAAVGAALRVGGALPPIASPLTIAITGSSGNVGRGALDALRHLGARALSFVEPVELAAAAARGRGAGHPPVYVAMLGAADVVALIDGASFDKAEYYAHPERFRPLFHERLLPHVSLLVNCAYWDMRYPRLLTARQLREQRGAQRLQMIADLSCDVDGAIEPLVRTTTVHEPYYVYDFATAAERQQSSARGGGGGQAARVAALRGDGVAVLGTDILPAELPREASEHLRDALFPFVPQLADRATASRAFLDQLDTSAVGRSAGLSREVWSAVIACDGELAPRYAYIRKIRDARMRADRQRAAHAAADGAARAA